MKLAYSRILGLVLALACFGAAVFYARESWLEANLVEEFAAATPFETEVDFSHAGEWKMNFRQEKVSAHGFMVFVQRIRTDADAEPKTDFQLNIFDGVLGEFTITSSDGTQVYNQAVDSKTWMSGDADYLLIRTRGIEQGQYTATLRIDAGASEKWAGVRRVYAQNMLCGLEMFPVMISGLIAVFSALVGLAALKRVYPGLRKDGFLRASAAPTSDVASRDDGGS